MIKVRCGAHRSVQDALLERLYSLGVMEAVPVDIDHDELQDEALNQAFQKVGEQLRTVEETLNVLRTASRPKRTILEHFLTLPRPKARATFERTRETFDASGFCGRVLELHEARRTLVARRRALLEEMTRLEPLRPFDVPFAEIAESKWTVIRLFQGPQPLSEDILPREAIVLSRQARGSEEMIVLACSRSAWPQLEETLAERGWSVIDVADLDGTPQEEWLSRQRALDTLQVEEAKIEEALQAAIAHMDDLLVVHDWLLNERERLEQMRRFPTTEATILLEGWARAASGPAIESALKPFADSAILTLSPPAPGESVPIILDNPSWLKPFEFITRMYGLPKYGQVDPTPWLAPFFLLFFSLCLTDAAYGAVLAVVAASLLRWVVPTGSFRRLVMLLFYGGLATILIGALAGGWFGNILLSLPGPLKTLGTLSSRIAVFDPIQDVLLFMGVVFALGYLQVCVGILIKMGHKMREGQVAAALLDEGIWLVFLNGVAAWCFVAAFGKGQAALPAIQAVVVAAGAVRVLTYGRDRPHWFARLGMGLASLYQAVGVMSDVLSYARVVALGLATGVIALVVDTLCVMTAGIPWVGLIVASVLFVVGHSFNLVINVIGAFIHTGRLQFVEFFSKFFVPGGPRWHPFKFESRYFVLEG